MTPAQLVVSTKYEWAKPHIEDICLEEVKIAIFDLKNWKVPDNDDITA